MIDHNLEKKKTRKLALLQKKLSEEKCFFYYQLVSHFNELIRTLILKLKSN